MPELPEVETVKRGLVRLLVGRTIISVEHDWPKSFPNDPVAVKQFVIGAKVVDVRRRAKVLLIDLDTDYTLVIHLKMTGQLVYRSAGQKFGAGHPNDSLIGELPDKSTRVIIDMDGATLYFNDQRKFGWMKLLPTDEVMQMSFFQKVGPEPLDSEFTAADFIKRLDRRAGSGIKSVLLDQSVIAGVGNIYADESLWAAKIHPMSRVGDLSKLRLQRLYNELRYVLQLSIDQGGSSDRNYVDAEGKRGSYLKFAKVFRLEGAPCPRCERIIQKTRVAGRGTHVCLNCQKQPKV